MPYHLEIFHVLRVIIACIHSSYLACCSSGSLSSHPIPSSHSSCRRSLPLRIMGAASPRRSNCFAITLETMRLVGSGDSNGETANLKQSSSGSHNTPRTLVLSESRHSDLAPCSITSSLSSFTQLAFDLHLCIFMPATANSSCPFLAMSKASSTVSSTQPIVHIQSVDQVFYNPRMSVPVVLKMVLDRCRKKKW